jgi:hypothetical protein
MTELRKAVDAHYNAYKALSHAYAALSEIIAKEPGLIPQQDPRIDEMREEIRQMRREIEEAVGRGQKLRPGRLATTSADPFPSYNPPAMSVMTREQEAELNSTFDRAYAERTDPFLDSNGKPRMTPTEAQRAYPLPGGIGSNGSIGPVVADFIPSNSTTVSSKRNIS